MSIFERYGEEFFAVTDLCPMGRVTRAFLSPISQTSREGLSRLTPAGIVDRGRFLLIAPASALPEGERLELVTGGGVKYSVLRCDRMGTGVPIEGHIEAVLRLEGRENGDA